MAYTCPANETAIIKTVSMMNTAAIANSLTMFLNGTGSSDRIAVFAIPAASPLIVTDLFIVLHPGDVIRTSAGTAGVVVSAHGAELEGFAD